MSTADRIRICSLADRRRQGGRSWRRHCRRRASDDLSRRSRPTCSARRSRRSQRERQSHSTAALDAQREDSSGVYCGPMLTRLQATLRSSPVTVPAFVALALSIVWLTSQAGYPLTHWAPGGLLVIALLAIAAAVNGLRLGELPKPVKIALAAFAAYPALSFLSILWADVPADAWEGANRTLLYLLVFALFACWPQHSRSAALLVIVWTVAVIVVGIVVALHLDGASRASLQEM